MVRDAVDNDIIMIVIMIVIVIATVSRQHGVKNSARWLHDKKQQRQNKITAQYNKKQNNTTQYNAI